MIRTAGTTLHHIFRNNYGLNHVEVSKDNFTPVDLKRLLRFNRRIRSFGGHYLRSTQGLEAVCPDLVYITWLRNPADRFISHYNHGRNRGHHTMTIEERLGMLSEGNYQTKFLLGAQKSKDREFIPTQEDLEKAKKVLIEDYRFVGIAEHFDESLVLMKEILKIQDLDIHYEKMHVTKKKHIQKDKISPDLYAEIKGKNQVDFELYRFAKERFYERQKKSFPGDLTQAVRDFNQINENYSFKKSALFKYRAGKYLVYKPLFKLASFFS
jgi:hypothetical protein